MLLNPWKLDAEAWEYIDGLPEEQRADAAITYTTFNYNSIKVPCITAFAMYGLFVVLILAAASNNLLAWCSPSLHFRLKRHLRIMRAYIWEHPLVHRSHADVVAFPQMRWLSLQLPLRGEAIVIFMLFLINFLPLVAFYRLFIGDRNVFYPGPTSKRDQICRHLADRTGILGTAQLPLLILMASKRTPLAIVSGLGMNRLMLYHRWISRWFWIHVVIHTLAYTAIYSRAEGGVASMLKDTYIRWGVVGLAMACGLVFLSLRSLRQRYYEVFIMLHIVMAFFAMLGTYLHIALIKYAQYEIFKVMTEIAAAVWAFDRVMRFAARIYLSFSVSRRTCAATDGKPASLLTIKCAVGQIEVFGAESDYTRLRISIPASKLRMAGSRSQGLMYGIAAGDDIRVTVPRLQWVGEHPFTVFAVGLQQDDATQGYIDLLIKIQAGLTRKLARHQDLINSRQKRRKDVNDDDDRDIELAGTSTKQSNVAVILEGPFGVAPEINPATTDLVLVAGGIAITFCWPLFAAAVESHFRAAAGSSLVSCKLIWIVRHETTLDLLREAFSQVNQRLQDGQGLHRCRFSVDIYITSSSTSVATATSALVTSGSSTPSCSIQEQTIAEKPRSQTDLELSGSINVVELPTLSHHTQQDDPEADKPKRNIFSDDADANVRTIEFRRFSGRPKPLSSALFGHLQPVLTSTAESGPNLSVGLCGPPSLCDDVRLETVRLLKKGIHVDLVEDCFTW